MILQSFGAALTFFAVGGGVVFAFTSDPTYAGRCAMLLASISLLISGATHHYGMIGATAAKIQRMRAPWPPTSFIEQPAPPALENQPYKPHPEPPERDIQLVTVYRNAPTTTFASDAPASVVRYDGADTRDLRAFIDGLTERGHSRSGWIGARMPSGRTVTTDYYELLVQPLVKCKAIVGRGPRVSGRLVLAPPTIKQRLQLSP
jgi:hypothetical protein